MLTEKILKIFIPFCLIFNKFYCQISECEMSADLEESRKSRLHHPCEKNKNPYFHIETHENFYCIFYSSIDTTIFGEAIVNIKVDGEWEVEQVRKFLFFSLNLFKFSFFFYFHFRLDRKNSHQMTLPFHLQFCTKMSF